jgi:hypothetical protein
MPDAARYLPCRHDAWIVSKDILDQRIEAREIAQCLLQRLIESGDGTGVIAFARRLIKGCLSQVGTVKRCGSCPLGTECGSRFPRSAMSEWAA